MSDQQREPVTGEAPTVTAQTVSRSGPARRASATLPERVGPYRVGEILGSGGMGVVARGIDERSGRGVALKFLDDRFTQDDDELARVEREGRMLAAIRDPHVALLLEIEDAAGAPVLVLELVEGETLGERLSRGALPAEEAAGIAAQVASALATAHARGIVHRDLKPANVKLAGDGTAKVLDFGVACRAEGHAPRSLASEACDADPGGVSGTLGYMSPEQLRGEGVTPRSDTWALGCLLYECLTGRRAFPGTTPQERLAATLRATPDLTLLPADVPDTLRDLVASCLALDPAARPRDGAAIARLLDAARGKAPAHPVIAPAATSGRKALPRPRSSFVGRVAEIATLRQAIAAERLVTLTGAGGSGKTRAALQLGISLEDAPLEGRFGDGIVFVELAVVSDEALVPEQAALALGVADKKGTATRDALKDAVAGKDILILLDNCEHVPEAAAALAQLLLEASPAARVLATSREPLRLPGERVVALAPLKVPLTADPGDVESLAANDAVALFVDRARAARRGFRLALENAESVARCCRRLDGIPLALELAAARLRHVPVDRLADELEDCFRVLTGGSPAALARHQALRATIDWSCDQLDAREAAVYRRLSVFAGPFTLPLAEQVAGDAGIGRDEVLPVLTLLQEKSLVHAEDGFRAPRFRLLEPVRQHAAERLASAVETSAVRARFVRAIADLAAASHDLLDGPELPACVADLADEHPNLLEAARLAGEEGLADEALRGLAEIGSYWVVRSLWREGRMVLDGLLAKASAQASRPRGVALMTTAQLSLMLGETDEAQRRCETARGILESVGDEASLAEALNTLSQAAWERVQLDEARAYGERSLALRRKLGLTSLVTNSLNQLGLIARSSGDAPAARKYLEEALAIQREVGSAATLAAVLINLAVAVIDQKDLEAARPLLLEAIACARDAGSKRGEYFGMLNLAHVEADSRRFAEALAMLQQAAPLAREAGDRSGAMSIVLAASKIAVRTGDAATAATLQGAALSLRDAIGAARFHNQASFDETSAQVREALGDAGQERCVAAGRAMDMEQALGFVGAMRVDLS